MKEYSGAARRNHLEDTQTGRAGQHLTIGCGLGTRCAMASSRISRGIMESGSGNVLCLADSNARLNNIARTLKRAGHRVILSTSAHNAVAIVAVSTNIDLIVIDEYMIVGDGSVAESIKAVKPLPIVLVCDKGPSTGDLPAGVDLVTANGSRQQILAGVSKLLSGHRQLKTSA